MSTGCQERSLGFLIGHVQLRLVRPRLLRKHHEQNPRLFSQTLGNVRGVFSMGKVLRNHGEGALFPSNQEDSSWSLFTGQFDQTIFLIS